MTDKLMRGHAIDQESLSQLMTMCALNSVYDASTMFFFPDAELVNQQFVQDLVKARGTTVPEIIKEFNESYFAIQRGARK